MSALPLLLIFSFILALGLGLWLRPPASTRTREMRVPAPILSSAIILAIGAATAAAPAAAPVMMALMGALVLYAAGLRSDFAGSATRRHFAGVIAAATFLFFGGIRVHFLGLPFMGNVTLGLLGSWLATVAWVFLVCSLFELCALVPLAAGAMGVLLAAGTLLPISVFETYHGLALAAIVAGTVAGRSLSNLLLARSRPLEKSEVLVLGFAVAALTLSSYLKSVTLGSFVLPVGVVVVTAVVLLTQSLDRSLILRPHPR